MSTTTTTTTEALTITSTLTLNDGRAVPRFGLGTWRSDKGLVQKAVVEALRAGYRHIDAAFVYANQDEVGAGIREAIEAGVVTREEVFVTSKVWNSNHSNVEEAARKINQELGLEYTDLLLLHWPTPFRAGAAVHEDKFPKTAEDHYDTLETGANHEALVATWRQMERVRELGLARSIGVSNFSVAEVRAILDNCTVRPATNQVEAHPFFPQDELRAALAPYGIVITAYSPLGNIDPSDASKDTPLKDPVVLAIAAAHNKSPAQILIRWSLQKGNIVIPKSTTPARIVENANVFDFELTADEVARLSSPNGKIVRFVNPPFRVGGKPVFE